MKDIPIRRQTAIEIVVKNIFKLDNEAVAYYATQIAQDVGYTGGELSICEDGGLVNEYEVSDII